MTVPLVRLMTDDDVPAAAEVSAAAFEFGLEDPVARERWYVRMRHSLAVDPEGAFVAEVNGRVAGVAHAIVRDHVWILSLLAVDPKIHSLGTGRALMDAALSYGPPTDDGLIVASSDPRALRLYASAGFQLHPTFQASGQINRAAIPVAHPGIKAVPAAELDSLAPISRAVRGATHDGDLRLEFDRGVAIFRLEDRGFVLVDRHRGVRGLAALDEESAKALLYFALSEAQDAEELVVGWITGRQQWAVEVLVATRLPFKAYGAVCVRGNPGPLHPYIPSPPFA